MLTMRSYRAAAREKKKYTVRNSLASWLFVAQRTIVYKDFVKASVRSRASSKAKKPTTQKANIKWSTKKSSV